jgi:D-amino-acid dehydrogenase
MSKSVVIIGGGVIGLCTAYYLKKEGHHVTVIDQSQMNSGASYVNAGYLSPSHIIPLSAPGVMKKGLKWMFNPASPLYIKPRGDYEFLQWAVAFNKSCNIDHVNKSMATIKKITLWSQQLYNEIREDEAFDFHLENKGLLMLCQSERQLEEEIKTAYIAQKMGLEVQILNPSELSFKQPKLKTNAIGATYYKCDSHSTPHEFMRDMKSWLLENGVTILQNERVENLELINDKIKSLITDKRKLKADEYVLAAGAWSSILSKQLGVKLLLQAGKGYRINTLKETGISLPAILAEAKVAVTPMNGFTRFAGTMEIAGINNRINGVRVEAIAKAVNRYFPDVQITDMDKNEASSGLRPVSPDGIPYIGKSKKCSNMTIATGHAMMGWSMATATGLLVSEIISDRKSSMDMSPFHPDRKF